MVFLDVKREELKEKELQTIERRKDSKEDPDTNPLPLKSPQCLHYISWRLKKYFPTLQKN